MCPRRTRKIRPSCCCSATSIVCSSDGPVSSEKGARTIWPTNSSGVYKETVLRRVIDAIRESEGRQNIDFYVGSDLQPRSSFVITGAVYLPSRTCLRLLGYLKSLLFSTMSSSLADRRLISRVLGRTVDAQRAKCRAFIFQDVLEDTATPAGQPILIRNPEDEV